MRDCRRVVGSVGDPGAPSREKPFLVSTGQGRFPGSRFVASLPAFPGASPEWRHLPGARGSGLAGYSGGTAQEFDLLPFYPPKTGGTLTMAGV